MRQFLPWRNAKRIDKRRFYDRNLYKSQRKISSLPSQFTVSVLDKFLRKSGYLADLTGFIVALLYRTSSRRAILGQTRFGGNLSGLNGCD
jgi:hypothetical protein